MNTYYTVPAEILQDLAALVAKRKSKLSVKDLAKLYLQHGYFLEINFINKRGLNDKTKTK